MARPLRMSALVPPHLTRERKTEIFADRFDRGKLIDIFGSVIRKHCWMCHDFRLMGNHDHLLVESPKYSEFITRM